MNKLSASERNSLLAKFANLSNNQTEKVQLKVNSVKKTHACSFKDFLLYKKIQAQATVAQQMKLSNPFMLCHDTIAKGHTFIQGKEYLNFATYDYLGFNGDPRLNEAANVQMQKFGTSAGASRLVAGERPVHRQLEEAIAQHYEQEDAIVFVSGHATNVSVISTLFGKNDLIIYDRLSHNSILMGARCSEAQTLAFAHNDMEALESLLELHRDNYSAVLIVTEGVFSMDGDIANLPELVRLKRKYNCFLMVDEAHSLGIIGKTGLGIAQYYNMDQSVVDIHMGTLSKTLCSCGGYIAGKHELIDMLKYYAPGFVYSVGISPVLAGASLQALKLLHEENFRVTKLQELCKYAQDLALSLGLDIGHAQNTAVLPIIIGSSIKATYLSNLLFEAGILALPIIFPAVEEEKARIRLFLSYSHTKEDIEQCLNQIKALLPQASEYEQRYLKSSEDQ